MAWDTNVDMPLNKETKPKLAKIDFFYILNWIVSNRTIFDMENALTLNWIAWKRTLLTKIKFILNWIILLTTVFQNWVAWNRKVFENETELLQNWIVWNRTVNLYKNVFYIN